MLEDTVSILYDHHKDTCVIIGEAIKKRDYLMVLTIIAFSLFAFQIISPDDSGRALNSFLNFKAGFPLQLSLSVIGSAIWFLLLIFVLRYFQISVFIERQYTYVHQLEDAINSKVGEDCITREGKSYLFEYPKFSDWMWLLYTIIFPALLFLVSFAKIFNEWNLTQWKIYPGLILNTLIFLILSISILLYLKAIHFNKKQKKK